jgi:hypothetical protein
MDRRRLGPPARHYRLTVREAQFIERCTNAHWRMAALPASRTAVEDMSQSRVA